MEDKNKLQRNTFESIYVKQNQRKKGQTILYMYIGTKTYKNACQKMWKFK